MYFIQYQPLKEKLRERTLSESEALPYLVVWGVLGNVWAMLWQMYGNFNFFNFLDVFSWALHVLIIIGGIYYVYSQNGGALGFDFIQKYYVLGWVVYVRCFLAFIPIMVIEYLFSKSYGFYSTNLFDVLADATFVIILFWRTGKHIRDTTKSEVEPPFSPQT